jgi:murein DD-endopeptidase MepM/ murein hydrolase activator NlpD
MEKRFSALLNNAPFYASLAVCIAAVAVGGYFLLFDRPEEQAQTLAPVYEPVTDTLSEDVTVPPEEHSPVSAPAQIIETPLPKQTMPEETLSAPIEPEVPVMSAAPRKVLAPLEGEVVAAFSVDSLIYDPTLEDWRIHDALDIAAPVGTEVMAAAAGVVETVQEDPMMGLTITISHAGGYETTYAGLGATAEVLAGDRVSAGEVIGIVGEAPAAEAARGPHLHFSVSHSGDVVNPEAFLAGD